MVTGSRLRTRNPIHVSACASPSSPCVATKPGSSVASVDTQNRPCGAVLRRPPEASQHRLPVSGPPVPEGDAAVQLHPLEFCAGDLCAAGGPAAPGQVLRGRVRQRSATRDEHREDPCGQDQGHCSASAAEQRATIHGGVSYGTSALTAVKRDTCCRQSRRDGGISTAWALLVSERVARLAWTRSRWRPHSGGNASIPVLGATGRIRTCEERSPPPQAAGSVA